MSFAQMNENKLKILYRDLHAPKPLLSSDSLSNHSIPTTSISSGITLSLSRSQFQLWVSFDQILTIRSATGAESAKISPAWSDMSPPVDVNGRIAREL